MKRLAVALLAAAATVVEAHSWPVEPPKIAVGYPPDGSLAFATQLIADELSNVFGVEAAAGVRTTKVQLKGGGPAARSLRAGDTQMMFAGKPEVREKSIAQGVDRGPSSSPEAFVGEIRAEALRVERSIRTCGAYVE